MQTFSFKTAKLTGRATVEVDRRWVRAAVGAAKQVHIGFNLIATIHYWVTQSRYSALTGHLVIRDKQGRKLALQCSGFGADNDFVEFLRATSAMLAAIGEARPDLRMMAEPTPFHRLLMTGVVLATLVVVGGWVIMFGADDDLATRAAGVAVGALIALGVVLFRFGPLRKKAAPTSPADLARQISASVVKPLAPTAT
ncbi:MAG TPA: hypothetical protein VGO52_16405 [Hyphomonadaceae bacterium]|nr:hypothetical protein [Hyphomonadaceae bacterium]